MESRAAVGPNLDGKVGDVHLGQYEPSYRLLEEARKFWNYAVCNELVHLFQPAEITSNALIGIAKDHVDGNVWVECHITFETEGNDDHFCVVIEHSKGQKFFWEIREFEIHNGSVHGYSSVLVNDAQLVKTPKQMALNGCVIRSLVRLKRFDDSHCICGYSGRVVGKLTGVRLGEDRELRPAGVSANFFSKSLDKLIQRRPEAIQEVARYEREFLGNRLDLKADDMPLPFKVILTEKGTGFRFTKDAKALPKVFKMFLRPSCFQIGIS